MDISNLTPKKMRKAKNGKRGTRYYDTSNKLVAKTCASCEEIKPTSDFNPAKAQSDGLFSRCRDCSAEYQRKYRETGPIKAETLGREQYIRRTGDEVAELIATRFPEGTKKCTSCGITKSLDAYYQNKSQPSVVSSNCKRCTTDASIARIKQLAKDNPDYYKEQYHKNKEQWKTRTKEELQAAREEAFPSGKRTCSKCNQSRSLDRFIIAPSVANATGTICSICRNKEKSEKNKKIRRTITPEELLNKQKTKHPDGTKRCHTCGEVKSIESYRSDPTRPDGLRRGCRPCEASKKRLRKKKAYESYWKANNIPFECYICGGPYDHSDHVIPAHLGGSDDPHNRLPICAYHNCSKGHTPLDTWLSEKHSATMEQILDKVVNTYNVRIDP